MTIDLSENPLRKVNDRTQVRAEESYRNLEIGQSRLALTELFLEADADGRSSEDPIKDGSKTITSYCAYFKASASDQALTASQERCFKDIAPIAFDDSPNLLTTTTSSF